MNATSKRYTRDLLFFILGIFTLFIIEAIVDWQVTKDSFDKNYNKAMQK
tara:strand:- start:4520 stop:4666 length:147 start_codon:yes stop_codon:yes gene_type:complete